MPCRARLTSSSSAAGSSARRRPSSRPGPASRAVILEKRPGPLHPHHAGLDRAPSASSSTTRRRSRSSARASTLFERFAEVTDLPGLRYRPPPAGLPLLHHRRGRHAPPAGVGDAAARLGPRRRRDAARRRGPLPLPAHRRRTVLQARYRAKDGWLKPKALTMGYARASGATICLETPATGFVEAGRPRRRRRDAARHDRLPSTSSWRPGRSAGSWRSWPGSIWRCARAGGMKLVIPELPDIPEDAPMTIDEETDRPLAARPARRLRPLHRPDRAARRADGQRHARRRTSPSTCSARPRRAPLARISPFWKHGLGARRARLGAPGRPVRVHARPPPVPRAERRCRDWCSTAATAATASWRARAAAA